jgi:hypothetical protein
VQLILADENGKVLRRMPADRFQQNKLTAITYKVGINELHQKVRAIQPQLKIDYKGRKFTFAPAVYTRLFAATPCNAKELRLPLRDQYIPEKWNLSVRRVQDICKAQLIPGTKKFGQSWAIPSNAEKPVDGRIKSGKYIKSKR